MDQVLIQRSFQSLNPQLLIYSNKILQTLSIWALSLCFASAQCPNFFDIKKNIFSTYQNYDLNRIDTLKSWQKNWLPCQFPKDSTCAILLYRLGNCYFSTSDYAQSINYFQETIQKLKNNNSHQDWKSKVNINIGLSYIFLTNYDLAIPYFKQILAASSPQFDIYKMESFYYLAFISKTVGDFHLASNYLTEAIILAKKLSLPEYLSRCYTEKGVLELYLKQFPIAYDNLKLAEKYSVNDIQKSISWEHLGNYFENISEYSKAIKYHKMALKLTDSYNKSTIFINLGNLYFFKLKQNDQAIFYYNKALENNNDRIEKIDIYSKLAKIFTEKGEFKKAFQFFNKGNNLANDIDSDREILPKNLEQLKYNGTINQLFTLNFERAKSLKKYSEFVDKYKNLQKSRASFSYTSLLIDKMRQIHTGAVTKYFWRLQTRPIYENAIETCLQLKDYENAFYFFEKSRSVMLNDKLNELGAKQKLSEINQKKEKEFINKIQAVQTKIEQEKSAYKKEQLNSQLFDIQEENNQFIKSLEVKNPAYYTMKYDTNVVTLKQMQSYLANNFKDQPATLVEYFVGDLASYALVVTAQKCELKKMKFDTKLAEKFLTMSSQKLQTKVDLDTFLNVSLALNHQLIKPLNITKGHLIISQDGTLLPFEALANSNKLGDYMVQDYAISYTYSAQSLLKNKVENTFMPNRNFIGFAPIHFTNNLPSLVGSNKAISGIASNYLFPTNLIDKAANKKTFLAQAKNYQIVQIFTHALADSNETEPRIYFADSTLKVSELSAENRFNTQLIVLSACKTGVGKLAKGEGVLSLARGFSMLGIPSTITSLWSVEDIDTYTVTSLFYKYLNDGYAKDLALQKAKIEFINSKPSSPDAWAGLVLVGESSGFKSINYLIWVALFGLILIINIAYFYQRKRKTV